MRIRAPGTRRLSGVFGAQREVPRQTPSPVRFRNFIVPEARHKEAIMPDGQVSHQTLIFDFFKEEADRLDKRTDWFLIFHAILFEAFFSARDRGFSYVAVGLFGLFTAFLWLAAGARQWWELRQLGACMEDEGLMGKPFAHVYRKIFESRRSLTPWWVRWARPTPAFAIAIPLLCTAVWAHLLGMDPVPALVRRFVPALLEARHQVLWHIVSAAAIVSAGIALVVWLGPGPKRFTREVIAAIVPPKQPPPDPGAP